MGYWDSLFNECSALEVVTLGQHRNFGIILMYPSFQDNFCYTLTDPTASALNGVFGMLSYMPLRHVRADYDTLRDRLCRKV